VTAGLGEYAGLNAEVYGISVDSPFAQAAWAKQSKITVTLLSDLNKKVARAYGVIFPGLAGIGDTSARAAFVIGRTASSRTPSRPRPRRTSRISPRSRRRSPNDPRPNDERTTRPLRTLRTFEAGGAAAAVPLASRPRRRRRPRRRAAAGVDPAGPRVAPAQLRRQAGDRARGPRPRLLAGQGAAHRGDPLRRRPDRAPGLHRRAAPRRPGGHALGVARMGKNPEDDRAPGARSTWWSTTRCRWTSPGAPRRWRRTSRWSSRATASATSSSSGACRPSTPSRSCPRDRDRPPGQPGVPREGRPEATPRGSGTRTRWWAPIPTRR
jgi:hypothetical protein